MLNTSRYWNQTYGLLSPGILAEDNGTSKTTMPPFTDLLKLKTGNEGMTSKIFLRPPQSPDLNLIENMWYVFKRTTDNRLEQSSHHSGPWGKNNLATVLAVPGTTL